MTRTMDGLVRTRAIGAGILVGATITAGLAFTSVAAAQVPNCGGNNDIKISPVLCQNTRTIDGTAFTVVLEVTADGAITASYSLAAPRAVDTPIRMRAHRGISSNTEVNEAAAIIAAGATSATLTSQTRCGQIDIKAVFTGNGDARGRVAAPYVTTASDCATTPTSSTPPSTEQPATTAPTTLPSGGGTTPTSAQPATTAASSSGTLPVTGSGAGLAVVSVLLVVGGVVLVTRSRQRGATSD